MTHLMTCEDSPIALGQIWLSQPLQVSTVPNTGRSPVDNTNRGLDEDVKVFFVSVACFITVVFCSFSILFF